MLGKIALEEAFEMEGNEAKSQYEASLYIEKSDRERYMTAIHDINDVRVKLADEHGIGYTIVSLTVPGIQGIADKDKAERRATEVNNWVAEKIKAQPNKLGAFACLSMHDPVQAGQELTRCVKELGFHGALLCDFQHAGPNGETYLFYDQPQYDAFWQVLQELDVPLYIHPAAPADVVYEKLYAQRKFLVGPPLSFANGVNLHLMGIVTNGVFDRFPNAKVIVGHLGEHLPFDFWRINHWIEDVKRPIAKEEGFERFCEKDIYHCEFSFSCLCWPPIITESNQIVSLWTWLQSLGLMEKKKRLTLWIPRLQDKHLGNHQWTLLHSHAQVCCG